MKGLAIIIGKPKGAGGKSSPAPVDNADETDDDDGPSEAEYGAELADMIGVDDKEAFIAALSGFVHACMRDERYGNEE